MYGDERLFDDEFAGRGAPRGGQSTYSWFRGDGLADILAAGKKEDILYHAFVSSDISHYPNTETQWAMLAQWFRVFGDKSEEKYMEATGMPLHNETEKQLGVEYFHRPIWSSIRAEFKFDPSTGRFSSGKGGMGELRILKASAGDIDLMPALPPMFKRNILLTVDAYKFENGAPHFYGRDTRGSNWSIHVWPHKRPNDQPKE